MSFQIAPRKRLDGFTLTSATLLYPIWYTTLNEAVSYARFLGRNRICEIRIQDSKGEAVEVREFDGQKTRRTARILKFT